MTPARFFPLIPFAESSGEVHTTASAQLFDDRLFLHYQVTGSLSNLVLPFPNAASEPRQIDGLWKSTCFECFFGIPGEEAYYEANISPLGDWSFYSFAGYRKEMHRPQVEAPRFHAIKLPSGGVEIRTEIQLPSATSKAVSKKGLEIGLAAVMEYQDGALEYRALIHAGEEPDFHRRESFILRLQAE